MKRPVKGAYGYFVSDTGLVYYPTGLQTYGRKDSKGYMRVEVKYNDGTTKTVKVHKLVALEFCHNPSGYTEINHMDSVKHHNKSSNLEWCTRQHNMDHYYKEGNVVVLVGEQHGMSKLTEEEVRTIKLELSRGVKGRSLAKAFGVSDVMISRIKLGKAWSHV